jgi:hypothetical protein
VIFLVPESIAWLCHRQPANALAAVNRSLARMRHAPIGELPVVAATARNRPVAAIFSPQLLRVTVLLSLALFLHFTSFYFVIKWVPKIAVDMGFTPAAPAGVLVWTNAGGASIAVWLIPFTNSDPAAR